MLINPRLLHMDIKILYHSVYAVTRALFHADDDALLNYLNDDGLSIEPEVRLF